MVTVTIEGGLVISCTTSIHRLDDDLSVRAGLDALGVVLGFPERVSDGTSTCKPGTSVRAYTISLALVQGSGFRRTMVVKILTRSRHR